MINWKKTHGVTPVIVSDSRLKGDGDKWQTVPDVETAASSLPKTSRRVMLAIGRMHLSHFFDKPQHFYLLRLVDTPDTPPTFPNKFIEISRGPFTKDNDIALMRRHNIDLLVAKNAGGIGTYAKIEVARELGIEVVMIDRPFIGERREFNSIDEVAHWLSENG